MDTGTLCNMTISQIYNRQDSSSVKVMGTYRMSVAMGHKFHRDVLPIPLGDFQRQEYPYWLLMLSLYLLTHESMSNIVPNLTLHPTLVILATKIMVHLRAAWMHNKSRVMELLEDLLSQICQLGNHNPSPIPMTTICVNGPTFVTEDLIVPGP